jgi:hypothetical protein
MLLAFALGLAAIEAGLHATETFWHQYDPRPYRDRLAGFRRQRWDAVIVGGSTPAYGIEPNVLRGTPWRGEALDAIFNCSLPLATSTEIFQAVEQIVERPPRLIVYGVFVSDFDDGRFEPQGPGQLATLRQLTAWCQLRPDQARRHLRARLETSVSALTRLTAHRHALRRFAAERINRLLPGTFAEEASVVRDLRAQYAQWRHGNGSTADLHDTLAHWAKRNRHDPTLWPRYPFLRNLRVGRSWETLDLLLDRAERAGVPVVLAAMPVSAHLERHHAAELAAYRERLAATRRSGRADVLEANSSDLGLSDEDFCDPAHLNCTGRDKFSAWLRGALERLDAQAGGET